MGSWSPTGVIIGGQTRAAEGVSSPWVWAGHVGDPATGALSARITQAGVPGGTYALSASMPAGWTGSAVEFVIDFVRTTGMDGSEFMDYTYDPGANTVLTTGGMGADAWSTAGPSQVLYDGRFPVAHSGGVPCGG
ncbi:MAG TPA: hypothetical protein VLH75_08680 [Longimicrobiales bacterium]|nr:hypothetical protein [Longimicrobiales bacterium]